jgi:phosphatidylglycerophosphate synthase
MAGDETGAPPVATVSWGDLPPVLIVAMRPQKAGAVLQVCGLTALERLVKQMLAVGHAQVMIASDGTCVLPSPLPPGAIERETPDDAALQALRKEMENPAEYPADTVRPRNSDLKMSIRVTDKASVTRAEDAIFAELKRGDLGLVARHLNKPVSFWITRNVLCKIAVTPNQVTIGAGIIGLIGAMFVAGGSYLSILFGLFLTHVQSVLDGCDGELARVRFQQSAIGEWLDTIVDDALNIILFTCLAIGISSYTGSGRVGAVGFFATLLLMFYNAIAYRELLRQGEGGEVLKVRWWFNGGKSLKEIYAAGGGKATGAKAIVMAAGRRDFFLAAWVVLSLFTFHRMILLYALVIGMVNATVAGGQLLWPPKKDAPSPQ